MKKVMIMMVGIVLISLSSVSAKTTPEVAEKMPNEMKMVIEQSIHYPNSAANNFIEGQVWIKVTLLGDSKLKIIDLSATNPELGNYVEQQLSTLYVYNTQITPNKPYYLKLDFNLIND